jgi:hypothetical protein
LIFQPNYSLTEIDLFRSEDSWMTLAFHFDDKGERKGRESGASPFLSQKSKLDINT